MERKQLKRENEGTVAFVTDRFGDTDFAMPRIHCRYDSTIYVVKTPISKNY